MGEFHKLSRLLKFDRSETNLWNCLCGYRLKESVKSGESFESLSKLYKFLCFMQIKHWTYRDILKNFVLIWSKRKRFLSCRRKRNRKYSTTGKNKIFHIVQKTGSNALVANNQQTRFGLGTFHYTIFFSLNFFLFLTPTPWTKKNINRSLIAFLDEWRTFLIKWSFFPETILL